jgi:ubiquitin carboxyl-terminal hydrolase L3
MDGRKKFPINHGPSSPTTLARDAIKVVKQFMSRDPKDIRFNCVLMAPQ